MSSIARTDTQIQQISSVPTFGAANSIATDPDFKSRILRVTDETLNNGKSFSGGVGGSGDICQWNKDSTRFFIDIGGTAMHFSFDPATMQAAPTGAKTENGAYSFSSPNRFYTFGLQVVSHDMADATSAPDVVVDFAGMLPTGFVLKSQSIGGVNCNDDTFCISLSAGIQNTGFYVAALRHGTISLLDTQAGTIIANEGSGILGPYPIALPDRFLIHNVKLFKGGRWAIITRAKALNTCSALYYIWEVGTPNLLPMPTNVGHFTEGFNTHISRGFIIGTPPHWAGYQYIHTDIPAMTQAHIIPTLPDISNKPHFDSHPSWHNCNSTDDSPILDSTSCNMVMEAFDCPWQNEVIAIRKDGTVFRFCHNFITGDPNGPYFSTNNGIGTGSQDGRWFMFGSDMQSTLGLDKLGNQRSDVFIVECNWTF